MRQQFYLSAFVFYGLGICGSPTQAQDLYQDLAISMIELRAHGRLACFGHFSIPQEREMVKTGSATELDVCGKTSMNSVRPKDGVGQSKKLISQSSCETLGTAMVKFIKKLS